ncbi:hypothetical protein T03_17462 [Trichinella britovi]|uniref:Uncharacterized protein n=1 Tax=Trichinella britovi TaxID=45882 RepID=A0A0V1D031_TRIBR|nr:hypothetical protein T03_17462 [Trichinella britovi]
MRLCVAIRDKGKSGGRRELHFDAVYACVFALKLRPFLPSTREKVLRDTFVPACSAFWKSSWKIFQTGEEPLERNEQHTTLSLVRHFGATSDDDNDNLHIEEEASARIQHLLRRPACQYSNGLTR